VGTAFLKHVTEGKTEERILVVERLGIRSKQLSDDPKEKRGYCKLQQQTLDGAVWRLCFGSAYGPVFRQTRG
jgi:hypothetical protein